MVNDRQGVRYVLHAVLMAHPGQASCLQGYHSVGCEDLAANDLGIVSGWKQSMVNWALLAMLGMWARTKCSDPLPCETDANTLI